MSSVNSEITFKQAIAPCEKCGNLTYGGRLILPTGWEMPLCQACYTDKESLVEWFASELDAAVSESESGEVAVT